MATRLNIFSSEQEIEKHLTNLAVFHLSSAQIPIANPNRVQQQQPLQQQHHQQHQPQSQQQHQQPQHHHQQQQQSQQQA